MLDVRRLRLLRELQLRGTLTGVAQALSYSPSLISQQLAILEREAGVKLLRKTGRRVQLTPQGELLAERTAELLDHLERAETELAASAGQVAGVVRIAVFQSAAQALVPPMLDLIDERHPALRVEVVEREPELGLFEVSARDFDLVVAEQYPGTTRAHYAELDRDVIGRDRIRFATPLRGRQSIPDASGDGTPDASIPLTAAATRPWVMEPRGTASREWAMQLCRAAGFEPDVRFETADLMTHVQLIRTGNAVGLLPDLLWAEVAPTMRLSDPPGQPYREIFSSTRRSAAASPALVAVRRALHDAFDALTPPA